MPEIEIKRTGPNPMDCEVIVHPSPTDSYVQKARQFFKDNNIEIKGVQLKNSNTPFDKEKILESLGDVDSLSVFETDEEKAFRENLCGPQEPFKWIPHTNMYPVRLPEGVKELAEAENATVDPTSPLGTILVGKAPRIPFFHDLDINSMYLYEYRPYRIVWNVRCDYMVFIEPALGHFNLRVSVCTQDQHRRKLRQLKKKMAHTKAINRPALRAEYKTMIARREQFLKHINSGLVIRRQEPKYDWEGLKKELEAHPIEHKTMWVTLPR